VSPRQQEGPVASSEWKREHLPQCVDAQGAWLAKARRSRRVPFQRPRSPHVAPRGRPTMKPHPKRGAHIAAMQRKMQRNRDNRTSQPKEIHSHLTIHCTYKRSSAPPLPPTIPLPGPNASNPAQFHPHLSTISPGPYAISSPILLWVQQFAPSLHLGAFTRSEIFHFHVVGRVGLLGLLSFVIWHAGFRVRRIELEPKS
jgi:hypothetical protein